MDTLGRTFRVRDWVIAVSIVAAIVAAYIEKMPIQAALGGNGEGVRALITRIVWRVGDGGVVALLVIVLAIGGNVFGSQRTVDTAIKLGVAGFWCLVFTKVGQFVLAEARPSEGGAMHFLALGGHGVSGHSSAAGVLFWPLFDATRGSARRRRIVVASALIGWALLVGWTRIWAQQHFLWNVIAGVSVGVLTGRQAVRWVTRARSRRQAASGTADTQTERP